MVKSIVGLLIFIWVLFGIGVKIFGKIEEVIMILGFEIFFRVVVIFLI